MKRFLSTILLWCVACVPLRAEDDLAKVIRETGPVAYLEGILNDPVLSRFTDPQLRLALLEWSAKWRSLTFDRTSVKTHCPSAFHEIRSILAQGKDKGLLITSAYTTAGDRWQPFDFKQAEFPAGCAEVVKAYYPVLAPYAADKKYIQDITTAIEKAVESKHNQAYVDLMATLAQRATGLAPYILARVDGVMKESGFDRRALNASEHRPGARYLGSRSLTDDLFASVFQVDTTTVPGVVVAITYLHEGKPVIIDTYSAYGSSVMTYLPDEEPKNP